MKISVFGLGYVGCVSAAGFAARGHTVVGVDVNPLKVRLIEAGQTPVLEAGLAESVAASVAEGRSPRRRRFRSSGQSGVPARGNLARGLREPAEDCDRRN